jgi:hypothetical protein
MTKWFVTVCVTDTLEVEAESRDEAEALALDLFDPSTADGPSVYESWEAEGEELIETMITDYEEKERVAELENFDPITALEKQIQTGELK